MLFAAPGLLLSVIHIILSVLIIVEALGQIRGLIGFHQLIQTIHLATYTTTIHAEPGLSSKEYQCLLLLYASTFISLEVGQH
jgi:hypothetical protein